MTDFNDFDRGYNDGARHAFDPREPIPKRDGTYYNAGFRAGMRYNHRAQTTTVPMNWGRSLWNAWKYEEQWRKKEGRG